jgi:hypothetical protein
MSRPYRKIVADHRRTHPHRVTIENGDSGRPAPTAGRPASRRGACSRSTMFEIERELVNVHRQLTVRPRLLARGCGVLGRYRGRIERPWRER